MKKNNVIYKQLYLQENIKVDNLFKLYKKDPYIARVVYFNDNNDYEIKRIGVFEKENGDFNIVLFEKKYGISVTNRIYSREKKLANICYKNKKFWLISNVTKRGNVILPLTLSKIKTEFSLSSIVENYLINKFSWLRHMVENSVLYNTAFNTIINKKIYSLKDALKYQYKVPITPAKILFKFKDNHLSKYFKYHLKYLDNIENLQEEWFDNSVYGILQDSLKMAKTLNKKINCSWTPRRLKEEHDKWAKIITEILYNDANRELNIDELYKQFANETGYHLLTETKHMFEEGMRMNHCVVTYVNQVDNGSCAIFHVDNYTLQVNAHWNNGKTILHMGQFSGYSNGKVPEELKKEVEEKINKFNKNILDNDNIINNTNNINIINDINIMINDISEEVVF